MRISADVVIDQPAVLDPGARGNQLADDVVVRIRRRPLPSVPPAMKRPSERRGVILIVCHVDRRAMPDQDADDVGVSAQCGVVEHCFIAA